MSSISDAIAVARRQLEDLIMWQSDLPARLEALTGVSGSPPDLAPASVPARSPVETALVKAEKLVGIGMELEEVAAEWGFRRDQSPVKDHRLAAYAYVYARMEWASRHYPMDRVLSAISDAHAQTVSEKPSSLNRICPAHPESMTLLRESPGGELYCPQCRQIFTLDEVNAAGIRHLVDANPPVTVATAAEILDIEPGTIRQWIRRARLEAPGGIVYLGEVYDCAHCGGPGMNRLI